MVSFVVRDFAVNTAIATTERNEALLKLHRADRAMERNQQVICLSFANNLWSRYRRATKDEAIRPSFPSWLDGKTLEETFNEDHFTISGVRKVVDAFFFKASHPAHNPFNFSDPRFISQPSLTWLTDGCQLAVNAKRGDQYDVDLTLTWTEGAYGRMEHSFQFYVRT